MGKGSGKLFVTPNTVNNLCSTSTLFYHAHELLLRPNLKSLFKFLSSAQSHIPIFRKYDCSDSDKKTKQIPASALLVFRFPQFDSHGVLETISSAFSIVFHLFVRFKATVTVSFLGGTRDGEHPVHELSGNGQCHGHAPPLAMLATWTR